MMKYHFQMLAGVALLCLWASVSSAGVLLSDDFEAETLGDDLSQLNNWTLNGGAGEAAVVDNDPGVGVNKAVVYDGTAGAGTFSRNFDLTGFDTIKIEFNLTENTGSKWFGVFIGSGTEVYRWQWNLDAGLHQVRLNGQANFVGPAIFSAGAVHEMELSITHNPITLNNTLVLKVGGAEQLNVVDTTGLWSLSSSVNVKFSSFTGEATNTILDDIVITGSNVPEPATLGLIGLGGLITIQRRH